MAAPGGTITARFYTTVLILSAIIAILGLPTVVGGIIAIVAVAKDAGIGPHDLVPMIMALAIFGIAGVVLSIWLLLRSANSRHLVDPTYAPQALPPVQRAQLQAPPNYVSAPLPPQREPFTSVTEHTTHHLQDYVAPPEPPRRA